MSTTTDPTARPTNELTTLRVEIRALRRQVERLAEENTELIKKVAELQSHAPKSQPK